MKKIINTALAVVAVAAASFGGYKAHSAYVAANMSEDELLMMENVEALSAGEVASYVTVKAYIHLSDSPGAKELRRYSSPSSCPVESGWKIRDNATENCSVQTLY